MAAASRGGAAAARRRGGHEQTERQYPAVISGYLSQPAMQQDKYAPVFPKFY
jgi:hypothetical protein